MGEGTSRDARLDAPATLHHVIVRGIEGARLLITKLRRTIALNLINEYGLSSAETARRLGISTWGVAQILSRSGDV